MRVLVTGLKGFTGRYLKDELERHGHEVIGLLSNLLNKEALLNEITQAKPEAVVHLAAIAFVRHTHFEEFYQVNLLGTRNLLESLAKCTSSLQSILLVSSACVYGNATVERLSEKAPTCPNTDYAVSKLAMEHMANLWANKLPLFIVRPFNYTGIGQSKNFLIPKIVDSFLSRSPLLELGNIDIWREFGDVYTVVEIYRKLLELKPVGALINVCSGKAYSLREILALARTITGHQPTITIHPKLIRKNEIRRLVGDNSRLHSLVGDCNYKPFAETLQWMLTQEQGLSVVN